MKKLLFSMLTLAAVVFIARTGKAQEKAPQWAEMKAFHTVMSGTFHPAEEGNLEPIKKRSGEMVAKAEEWNKSTPPKEFNKPGVKEALALLVTESKSLDEMVKKKAGDAELTKALTALHDRFHSVVGACNAGDEKHEKHDDHEGHKH